MKGVPRSSITVIFMTRTSLQTNDLLSMKGVPRSRIVNIDYIQVDKYRSNFHVTSMYYNK